MKITIYRFFIVCLAGLSVLFWPGPAHAQSCVAEYELIFELKTPSLGAFNLWDTVYGKMDSEEEFATGLVTENGNVVVAGVKEYRDVGKMGPVLMGRRLIVGEIDLRGRVMEEVESPVKDLSRLVKILPHEKGYVVLAHVEKPKTNIRSLLIFTDATGKVLNKKFLSEKGQDVLARDIELSWDQKNYLIVATVSKNQVSPKHTVFYRLSTSGKVLSQRSYRPGLNNILLDISRSDEKFYVATGHIEDDRGRQNGWVLKLNGLGEIVWQRQYPRGNGARLLGSADFPMDDRMVVVGQALPKTGGKSGGWVMMLDRRNGDTVWQRYYTSEHNNTIKDLIVGKDGVISALMSSKSLEEDKIEGNFMRLLTINSRGVLFLSEEYYNGEGAEANQVLLGYGRSRVMVGRSQKIYQIEEEEEEREKRGYPLTVRSMEGWVLAAPGPEIYNDPCKPRDGKEVEDDDPSFFDAESVFP